jgi:predicted small lipoprotein YifL
MKKYLFALLLVAVMLAFTACGDDDPVTTPPEVSTEPATEVLTDEPTRPATEVPTAEPTVEPTDEPTAEPTEPPVTQPEEMTEQEAWALVSKAIRNSAYNSAEEFAKLPPVVQRLVGSPSQLREWGQMDSDTVNSVVASNFQRSYRARAKNERDYLALPSSVKSYMAALADGMKMPELPDAVMDPQQKHEMIRRVAEL